MTDRYAAHALRSLLQPPGPTMGLVVRVVGGIAEVATAKGVLRVRAESVRAGQRVRVSGATAYPAAVARAKYAL
jgi:hypothetical protein